MRPKIRQDCTFGPGGRLDRNANQWLRSAYEAAELERLPHSKYVLAILRALEERHNLCYSLAI